MKVVWLSLVLLNFSWCLPPARRYGYDFADNGYRIPLALDTRLGGRYADVGLPRPSQGDHSRWCPLRARDAMRSSVQRLPDTSRTQGPSYFQDPSDDGVVPRYGRSYQTDSHARQTNDFNENSSYLNEDGVDVGGIFWPRRQLQKLGVDNTKPDCGCHHGKVATLAKDATAAAANAATAAALAARAAAKAAAAAACGREDPPKDQVQDETSSGFYSAAPSERRLEYSTNDHENDYHDDEGNSQDDRDLVNSQDNDDNELPQERGSIEDSQEITDEDNFSRGTTRSELDSGGRTDSQGKLDDKSASLTDEEFSNERDISTRRNNDVVMNSQDENDDGKLSKEFSQGSNGSDITSRNGVNQSKGLDYSGKFLPNIPHPPRYPGTGVNTQSTNGVPSHVKTVGGMNSQGRTGSGVNSQGLAYSGNFPQNIPHPKYPSIGVNTQSTNGVPSQSTTVGAMNPQGRTGSGVNSQGVAYSGNFPQNIPHPKYPSIGVNTQSTNGVPSHVKTVGGMNSQGRTGSGVNSQGLAYSGNFPQNIPHPKYPGIGVNTQSTNGVPSQGTIVDGMNSQDRTTSMVNSQGTNSIGVNSQGPKDKGTNLQMPAIGRKNSNDKSSGIVDGHPEGLKMNSTSTGSSNVYKVSPPEVVRSDS